MTPELYQQLTGVTIPESQLPQYTAWINRANAILWDKLGWTVPTEDYITIAGKTKTDCPCEIDRDNLDPAPQIRGQARVYPVNIKEPNVLTDPFTKVHAVYLCKVEPEGRRIMSENNSVVITKTVENWSPAYFSNALGKYIRKCMGLSACLCSGIEGCKDCINVLVDADWVSAENMPDDLLWLIVDYVEWLKGGGATNAALNLTSESVTGHSVSYGKGVRDGTFNPYNDPANENILLKYSGPYGSVKRFYFS